MEEDKFVYALAQKENISINNCCFNAEIIFVPGVVNFSVCQGVWNRTSREEKTF